MKYNYVFWDWNGTLYDDAFVSLGAVNKMLGLRGLDPIDIDTYRDYVDTPIVRFYEKTFDMSVENMDELGSEFNSFCRELLPDDPLRVGTRDVLRLIADLGIKQCIFSACANVLIMAQLEKSGISEYFTAVLGADDFYVQSKVARTVKYISDNSIDPQKILFVGDSEHDLESARECGGDCVLITGGHRPEKALRNCGVRVITSLCELGGIIQQPNT